MVKRKVFCDYCGAPAKLIDSKALYGGVGYGMMWRCNPCDAHVGVHANSPSHAPLGRLANGHLRRLKMRAHKAFDEIWREGFMSRRAAYAWLAAKLDLPPEKCHIGMFNPETCKEVIAHSEKYIKART